MKKFLAILMVLALSAGAIAVAQESADTLVGDVNGDGKIDIADPIYTLRYLFAGGPAPVARPVIDPNPVVAAEEFVRVLHADYAVKGEMPYAAMQAVALRTLGESMELTEANYNQACSEAILASGVVLGVLDNKFMEESIPYIYEYLNILANAPCGHLSGATTQLANDYIALVNRIILLQAPPTSIPEGHPCGDEWAEPTSWDKNGFAVNLIVSGYWHYRCKRPADDKKFVCIQKRELEDGYYEYDIKKCELYGDIHYNGLFGLVEDWTTSDLAFCPDTEPFNPKRCCGTGADYVGSITKYDIEGSPSPSPSTATK